MVERGRRLERRLAGMNARPTPPGKCRNSRPRTVRLRATPFLVSIESQRMAKPYTRERSAPLAVRRAATAAEAFAIP